MDWGGWVGVAEGGEEGGLLFAGELFFLLHSN